MPSVWMEQVVYSFAIEFAIGYLDLARRLGVTARAPLALPPPPKGLVTPTLGAAVPPTISDINMLKATHDVAPKTKSAQGEVNIIGSQPVVDEVGHGKDSSSKPRPPPLGLTSVPAALAVAVKQADPPGGAQPPAVKSVGKLPVAASAADVAVATGNASATVSAAGPTGSHIAHTVDNGTAQPPSNRAETETDTNPGTTSSPTVTSPPRAKVVKKVVKKDSGTSAVK